jgi:hypothetical protein
LLASLLGAVWATPAIATDFVLASFASTQNGLLLSGATTNATVGVLAIEQNLHHTIVLNASGGTTNTCSVLLARTLDGATWISFSTNTLAGGQSAEVLLVGKWQSFQATLTATNALLTVTATYLGGR